MPYFVQVALHPPDEHGSPRASYDVYEPGQDEPFDTAMVKALDAEREAEKRGRQIAREHALKKRHVELADDAIVVLRATAETRYSFTAQFLVAATIMSNNARSIEDKPIAEVTDADKMAHRGYVAAAIMQSAAAIESEIAEVCMHGPGHHLSSNGLQKADAEFLAPLADMIDDQSGALTRYRLVLHLLRKTPLDEGAEPWQSAELLMKLRNEVVHYKSRWSSSKEGLKLWRSLQHFTAPHPPFVPAEQVFFPHKCLSAACSCSAVRAASGFIDAFYGRLTIASPLEGYRDRILR